MPDVFTVGLKFKNAQGEFSDVTNASGEVGASVSPGLRVAYWDDPKQDMPNVETVDAQVMVEALPNSENETDSYALQVNSVSRLKDNDGIGNIGDVRVEYEIVQQ